MKNIFILGQPRTGKNTIAKKLLSYGAFSILAMDEVRHAFYACGIQDVYAKDNTTMVPLREVAEAAGFTVTWDAENRAVILNDGVYSLKIGENSYVKGKMMPLTLSAAPEIVNDLTYVPAEFSQK